MSIPKEMSRDILFACIIKQFGTDGKLVIKAETAKEVIRNPHKYLPVGDEIVGEDFVIEYKPMPKEIIDGLERILRGTRDV